MTDKAYFVYMGKTLSSKDKLMFKYAELHEPITSADIPEDDIMWFSKPLSKSAIIGGIYTAKVEARDATCHMTVRGEAEYLKMWSDTKQVLSWIVATTNAETTHSMHLKQAKMASDRNIGNFTLQEIRVEYSKARSYEQRASLLAVLIDFISH